MYHPSPLASRSIRRVPPLGCPEGSYWVMTASASCPGGRSVIWRLMLKRIEGCKNKFQNVSAVELILSIN